MTNFCSNCGNKFELESKFCSQCGFQNLNDRQPNKKQYFKFNLEAAKENIKETNLLYDHVQT